MSEFDDFEPMWPEHRLGESKIWINKRSGTAHLYRDCPYIEKIPDGAFRVSQLHSENCSVCSECAVRLIDRDGAKEQLVPAAAGPGGGREDAAPSGSAL